MFYRQTGRAASSYADDARLLPVPEERWLVAGLVLLALLVLPLVGTDYLYSAVLVPVLVLGLAGLGQNLLTGFAGQLSVGSAAFMSVGAFAAYNFSLRIEGMPLLLSLFLGGACAALVGVLFGLPSLRIKGFYLIVSTLAAQFFVQWTFTKVAWFSNSSSSGVISAPPLTVLGRDLSSPSGRYVLTLSVVLALTLLARNLIRANVGRSFMAVRDMDTAAAVIGIPILRTKLLAFALSSFYLGVAGALWAFAYLGTVEPHGFDLTRSFQVLFVAIIGGLGSISGSYIGAAFVVLLPVCLDQLQGVLFEGALSNGLLENIQKIIFGSLILLVLIKEPEGLTKLLSLLRDKLRSWPLPD
ncbi:MAG: inner-rane translocator [Myxococcaceae bacterium]|nr:inner-rane translocator [Myxococcaceae bacterium]